MSAEWFASVDVVVRVVILNQDVIERVTGPGGDEWRSRFYPLVTAEDVIAHLASNYVRNNVEDISRLEGWADCNSEDVIFDAEDMTVTAEKT